MFKKIVDVKSKSERNVISNSILYIVLPYENQYSRQYLILSKKEKDIPVILETFKGHA